MYLITYSDDSWFDNPCYAVGVSQTKEHALECVLKAWTKLGLDEDKMRASECGNDIVVRYNDSTLRAYIRLVTELSPELLINIMLLDPAIEDLIANHSQKYGVKEESADAES